MAAEEPLEASTTPPTARPWVLAVLGVLAIYFALGFRLALGGYEGFERPALVQTLAPVLWVGRWRMFTNLRTTHTDLDAEVLGTAWQPVDLAALYPARWDEGPGYTRDPFLRDPARVESLAEDLCDRMGAQGVRLTQVVFDKTPGSLEQPRVAPRATLLLEHDCGG